MLQYIRYVFIISCISMILSSCALNKKYVYFYNSKSIETKESLADYSITLKPDDLLGITVSTTDMSLVTPFNSTSSIAPYGTSSSASASGVLTSNPSFQGYLINKDGMIDFPVIGKLKLAGLTTTEASKLIIDTLKSYISTPITVNVRIQNFKVIVLGDVARPGTFIMPSERVTLLEVIGVAGDLTISGLRKNILIIRDEDGKKKEIRVDLTSAEFMNNPSAFYLKQNDILYVQPNKLKMKSPYLANVGLAISLITLMITILNFTKK